MLTSKFNLNHLFNLKYDKKVRAVEIGETKNNFQQAIHLKKQLNKIQEVESKINAQQQN